MTAVAVLATGVALATTSPPPAPGASAVITVGSLPTMSEKRPRYDYASALFVDSTRGAPETGYWKIAAGEVTLLTGSDTIPLPASHDIYSGVGYFSKERAVTYAAGTVYTIDVTGSDSIGAVHASVRAPSVPRILAPAANDTTSRSRDLVIRWTPGDPRDSIQIELQPHSPAGFPHLFLTVPDSGRFALSRDVLDDFPSGYATMITVTRRAETLLKARGLRDGAFRAQAADFVHVYLEPRRPKRRE